MPASRRGFVLLALLTVFVACGGYLFFWPVGIDPESWTPPALRPWMSNDALIGATVLQKALPGPEAVAIDAEGRLVTGLVDGRIVRFAADGSGTPEVLAKTGGRPLGLKFGKGGNLIVADAYKGLISIAGGTITILATEAGGKPLRLADDLAIAQDGTIYFSDASTRWPLDKSILDILEHRPSGRLLAYHPDTNKTEVVLDRLYFANGVALGPDDAYVLVTETGRYRVRRYWLRGELAGKSDVFMDNLPGFPDNITWSPTRRAFWLAMATPRDSGLDKLAPYPTLRKVVVRLPSALQPKPRRHAWVVALDEKAAVAADLQYASDSSYSPIASVIEHDGWLYLGSFSHPGVARIMAP